MPLGMVKENLPLGALAKGTHCVSSVCAQNPERSFISPVHGMKNGCHYFERGVNGSQMGTAVPLNRPFMGIFLTSTVCLSKILHCPSKTSFELPMS